MRTTEMDIRRSSSAENALDAVMLLETIGFDELQAILADVQSKLTIDGVIAVDAEPYRLAYLLAA